MTRSKLLGVNVDIIDEEEAFERVLKLSELDSSSQVILLDTYLLMKAKFNKELFNAINSSAMIIPVSKGIRRGLSFISKEKCNVMDKNRFIIRLLSFLEEYHKTIYLLGGGKKIIQKAEKNMKDSFPGLKVMGSYHVKYKHDFEKNLLTNIQKISPTILLVSMSRPKEEKWIHKNKRTFRNTVCIGIEGFIDYVGEKHLQPVDKILHTLGHDLKNMLRKPGRIFINKMFVLYLLVYKIFKLEKRQE